MAADGAPRLRSDGGLRWLLVPGAVAALGRRAAPRGAARLAEPSDHLRRLGLVLQRLHRHAESHESPPVLLRRAEKPDEIADGVVAVLRVAKRKSVMDLVAIPASVARPRQVPGFREFADDLRGRSLGDADRQSYVSQSCGRLLGDDREHVGVVRDEAERVIGIVRT